MPLGGVGAIGAALAAGWLYFRRRRAAGELDRIAATTPRLFPGAERSEEGDGGVVMRVVVRDVLVHIRPGVPASGDPPWPAGLGVTAPFVTGCGPAFHAAGTTPDAHLRRATPTQPLRLFFDQSIPIVGEHVEARPLVERALAAIEPTGPLLAPHLRSDGREVSVWLARSPSDDDLPAVLERLVQLVVHLARWNDDVLHEYARATDAVVSIDRHATPPLRATIPLGTGLAPIVIDARYQREPTPLVAAFTFAVRVTGPTEVAVPTERVPLAHAHPDVVRRVPALVEARAPRARIHGEPGLVVVEWAQPPSTTEMVAAVEIVRALGPSPPPSGPFR